MDAGCAIRAGVVDVVSDEFGSGPEDDFPLSVPEFVLLAPEIDGTDKVLDVTIVVTIMFSAAFLFNENGFGGASVPLKEPNVTPTGESNPITVCGSINKTRMACHME